MPFSVKQLSALKVSLASPDAIRGWSHGEVTKAETLNHRTQKPEPDGLFCEKIFGPAKDYECHCGKYKKIRFQGIKCEVCGVEVISKQVRRERMGHIELASPCTHIWYLKGSPARIALVLNMPPKQVEEIVYYLAHACITPGNSEVLRDLDTPYLDDAKGRIVFSKVIKDEILPKIEKKGSDYQRAMDLLELNENPKEIYMYKSNIDFISKYTGATFGEGGDAIKKMLENVNIAEEKKKVEKELAKCLVTNKSTADSKRTKLSKRLETLASFINSGNRPEWMVLDVIPVIPPDLRPMLQLDGGRFAASDFNDLYRRIITRNNTLKKLIELSAPSTILTNERRMLQEAVDALIDNSRRLKPAVGTNGRNLKSLSDVLKGKQGRFRQNLLGKRVDYSGRSVIAVGPDLKMYQCGLPREMAIQLLRPFIASILIRDGVVTAHKQADKLINQYDAKVYEVLEEIIDQHPVLLNRAPTLHRLGIQAFQPKLVDGRAIRLHPLVCTGFNADFDGDQMAVHVPLSKAAQEEAFDLMLASNNILGPKDGKPIVSPSQDMILGNYYLTLEETKEDFLKKAESFKKHGDEASAELFTRYANNEGKVYGSVDEVELALNCKVIHEHSRIAILGKALKKINFTEEMNKSYLITTAGKVIFNKMFPSDFPYLNDLNPSREYSDPFSNEQERFFAPKGTNIPEYIAKMELVQPFKKKDFGHIVNAIYNKYGTSKTSAILDKIKDIGFSYSTKAGITFSLFDMKVVETKKAKIAEADKKVEEIEEMFNDGLLSEEEKHKQIIEIWTRCKDDVKKDLKEQLYSDKKNPLFFMLDSGARGSMDNFIQLEGIIGLMSKPNGDPIEIPIRSSYGEGLTVSEFFIGTHGARKGGADTALKTADSGYLTRRLVDVSQDVIVREEDCGTDHGFVVKDIIDDTNGTVLVKLEDRLYGRYSLHAISDPKTGEVIVPENTLISADQAKAVVASGIKEVEIRSLFGCQTIDGVCKHCYGKNLATGKEVEVGEAVGIMAAQSIGEPGTQLTMRTFHTGGVAGSDITQGLPRVQELVEARNPKGKAIISEITGEVKSIEPIEGKEGMFNVTIHNDFDDMVYETAHGDKILVKKGGKITAGEKITAGSISPKELLDATDIVQVENYMLREIRKPYHTQGIDISDKHLEIIIKQMLSKVRIVDSGDTNLLPGTRVSQSTFTAVNQEVLLSGKDKPAVGKPMILGITKAALESNSFLSAASFQETTKILTDAAIKGKVDKLHGLKENVITGKLIPAGRGLLNEDESKAILHNFNVEDKLEEVKDTYIEALDLVGR